MIQKIQNINRINIKQRYKILIEYDGTLFHGWQKQANNPSVQEKIEDAIYSFSGERINVYGSGRTDSGVHALGQIAHFELNKIWPENIIASAINHFLKNDCISIIKVTYVNSNFHARFSAIERSYLYRILNRNSPSALDKNRVWHIKDHLDHEKMQSAAQFLIGKHDFTSFRSSKCQALSPIKSIKKISIIRKNDEIEIFIQAPSFLHNQVRIIVGNLRKVGNGTWPPNKIATILQAKDRCHADMTAPSHGLYLYQIDYLY